MSDLSKKLHNLSPEQRELLLRKLQARKKAAGGGKSTTGIPKREDVNDLPLSHAQERLWFFDQLVPGSPLYNISAAVKFSGPLKAELLEKSINAVVERHEILQVFFETENGAPSQKKAPATRITLKKEKLAGRSLEELATEEAQTPFDLAVPPLIRARLVEMDAESHALMLTIHHIVADGWSMGVFINETARFYRRFNGDDSIDVPPLDIQYFDYAWWQKNAADRKKLEAQLDFWSAELKGMPTLLELPFDHSREALQTFEGRHYHFEIDPSTTEQLRELSRRSGATLFITLLAAFQALLYRYSNQDDFGVGIPIANRNKKELEALIGFFVNTLVIRAQCDGRQAFSDFLEEVKKRAFRAYDHQDVPFEQVVEKVQPQRNNQVSPLFQVMFELQGDALAGLNFGDLSLENIDFETGTAKFDLLLIMEEGHDRLKGVMEYNSRLFQAATIEHMMEHFALLLQQIGTNPRTELGRIDLMADHERKKLLEEMNRTEEAYPEKPFIHQYTARFAARNPEHPALVFDEGRISYARFEELGNRLAHLLIKHGVGRDTRVGVCMERSPEMVVALHGILKAGGAYVPFDPHHPSERREFMLADSGVALMLTQPDLSALFENAAIETVELDDRFQILADEATDDPRVEIDPRQLAYMIYTSGSTGKPKGTLLEHRSILNRLIWMQKSYPLTPEDVVLQKTPFSFDVSVWEFFWPFMYGATLAVARAEGHKDSAYLIETIRGHGVTTMHFVPPMLKVFLENRHSAECSSLKRVICSGEALPYALSRQFYTTLPGATLINLYGPTEAAVDVTAYVCPGERADKKLPIGRPIANTQIYILDEALNPVPAGVGGELYIAGVQLARGYANRPDLTSEKFIANPYSALPGDRMYKTGDLCRYLADGNIEYLGRIDHQVKVRGFRIELGEIEAVLREHASIRDCIVLVREHAGEKTIVAWYIAGEGREVSADDLRQHIARSLPDYMVPGFFIALHAFPLTPNGKIDRRALPDVDIENRRRHTRFVSPRNRLESYLAEVWKEVLGISRISMYDNFFDLGGNSLKAAVLINRLQEIVDQKLHIGMVFQAPYIAEFAMFAQEYFSQEILRKFKSSFPEQKQYVLASGSISARNRLNEDDVQKFRHIIKPLPARKTVPLHKGKNKQAIFLLSPPRSGSTLLRVMLAGNNRLFSPPELDLLSFNSMGERHRFFTEQKLPLWLEATTQAIKEINRLSTEEAEKTMREMETRDISVKDFYHYMQQGLGQRLLVDKTPSYALDPAILQRAEEDFDRPLYIHLLRHPYAMIYSFIEAKLDKNFFKYPHDFNRQQLAELIWQNSHQNILDFLQNIPDERHIMIRFEDILFRPEAETRRLCAFLNIPFSDEMLKPYHGKKMTDGLKDSSQMVGDFKFYLHRNINNTVADKWKKFHKEDFLSPRSEELARRFEYETETGVSAVSGAELTKIESVPRQSYMPLSFAQQRLWFIDQLEPGNKQYNVPGAVRIRGRVDAALLEQSLNLLIERHEILRTTFHTVEGRGMQRIHGAYRCTLRKHDLRALEAEQAEAEARELVNRLAQVSFKLDTLPLFHTDVIFLNDEECLLVLVAHHIITDGWSNGIFIHELSRYYDLLKEKHKIDTTPPAIQYVDVAAWQRKWIESAHARQELAFWEKELADAPPLLEIPTDFPRTAGQAAEGRRLYFELDPRLSQELHACCGREGSTSFMVLMAAFQTLMHHYANQDDVLIGTPVAGRTQKEMESLIGFFVNTLVMRTRFKSDDTFRDILGRVQNKAREILSHQNYPFEKLLDALKIERSLEHAPLFQVMFSMQGDDTREFSKNFEVTPYRTDSGTAKFDLLLEMFDSPVIRGAFEYNTALFRDETVERLLTHFKNLLAQVLRNPDVPLRNLVLCSDGEYRQIIRQWNRTDVAFPAEESVPARIARQALATPDAPALSYEGHTLTYREFDNRVNRLARHLIGLGLKTEDRVAVCLDRSDKLVLALHGIMRAGGVYVPLDPEHPLERTRFMMRDSGATLVISSSAHAAKFTAPEVRLILTDDWEETMAPAGDEPVMRIFSPKQLAYMIYTSGSTGRPKGTLLQHDGFLNRLQWMQQAYPLDATDTVLQKTPFSFDVSVWEFFWPFMYGARLAVARADGHRDTAYLTEIIQRERVTTMHFVPPMLKVFLEDPGVAGCVSLKNVICSGEALPYALSRAFYKKVPGARLHNLYGPTEATIDVSHYTCPEERDDEKLPIGRPVANTRLYILNRALNPVPVGVSGELHIGGIQLARGYANRPDLTAEKFIPDPFSIRPGARMYKTGDVCRFLENGEIEYISRIDHQVKVRGFRIELGEIEQALRALPAVEDCVVLARAPGGGEKSIVAYVVSSEEQPSQGTLRKLLKNSLPEYMIPSAWIFMESIPLTANGKIDRKALPDPSDVGRGMLETEYVAPRNEREALLARLWQETLKMEKVGVLDNFFELGGDSIVGIQLISAAARQGLSFTPRELFEYPTIEGLASVAREGVAIHAEQETLSGPLDPTPILRWFSALPLGQRHHWNQSIMLKSHHPLKPGLLSQVAARLYRHHDMLRLHWPSGRPRIAPPGDLELFNHYDLREEDTGEQQKKLKSIVQQVQGGHDFENGPLFKMIYFSLDPALGDRLFISLHHTVVDAVSWRVLLEDLQMAYALLLEGREVSLPAKTTSYAYWAGRLNRYALEHDWSDELDFWQKHIGGQAPTLEADMAGDNLYGDRNTIRVHLPEEQTSKLQREVPEAYNTRIVENILSALYMAWHALSGKDSLLIDMEGHGREALFEEVDLARTVGWFTALYPFNLRPGTNDTGEIIKNIKEDFRSVPQNGMGFGVMRYLAAEDIRSAMEALPRAAVLFNYLGQFEQDEAMKQRFEMLPEETGDEIGAQNRNSHLLEITSSILDGKLSFNFNFCPDTLREETIREFASQTIRALEEIIEHSLSDDAGGYTPSDFSSAGLDQDELDDVLSELDDLE